MEGLPSKMGRIRIIARGILEIFDEALKLVAVAPSVLLIYVIIRLPWDCFAVP